jgi:phage terminase large subunit-like protein
LSAPSKRSGVAARKRLEPDPKWAPRYFTSRVAADTDGDHVNDYAEALLHVAKGPMAGSPLLLTDWQRWLLDSLLERRSDGRRRYRRALIGLGRKNGKSLFGSALALYHLTESTEQAEVYAAAGDRQQARIVFGEAKWQIQNAPELAAVCKLYRDAIEYPATGSVFRVLSADARLQQGLNPSLVIFDEVHVQPSDDLWDALTLGSGARVDPLVVGITTAGHDMDTLCGRLYQYGLQVARGEIADPSFGFWWWEAPDDCAVDDPKAWAAANPNLSDGLLDLEDLEVSAKQTQELAFRRYRLNQWTRSKESWLPPGAWEACRGDARIDPDLPVFVGIDMALKHDSVAVVAAQGRMDGTYAVEAKIWLPQGDTIDVAGVEAHLRKLHRTLNVKEFAYDPAYFERSAQALADDGLPMLEFPQSSQRMVPACGHAYEVICSGRVVHGGDPIFSDQVQSASPRVTGEGWRLSKGKAKRKIDAAIALVIALDRASTRPVVAPTPRVVSLSDL